MNTKKKVLAIASLAMLMVLACNLPFGLGTINPTTVAQTFAAGLTETVLSDPGKNLTSTGQTLPTATTTTTLTPSPTSTAPVTVTLSPSHTPSLSPTLSPVTIPCNRAAFVADITYPDNSQITKDTSFVKTWRLQNNGSCTWTSGYKLVFSHGDRMDAPNEVTLTSVSVPPGGTVDASVNLKSPSSAGTYQGNFKLKAPDGQIFGIGGDASGSFYVLIQVVVPAPGITFVPLLPHPMVPLLITSYNPSYTGAHSCFVSNVFHYFKIENNGGTDLESWRMNLTDNTTASGHGIYSNDSFTTSTDCLTVVIGKIASGNSGIVGIKEYSDITGHNMTATFKMCTADGLGGVCVDKSVSFVAE